MNRASSPQSGAILIVLTFALCVTPLLASAVGLLGEVIFANTSIQGSAKIGPVLAPLAFLAVLILVLAVPSRVPRLVRCVLVLTAAQVALAFASWAMWNSPENIWRHRLALPLEQSGTWAVIAVGLILLAALGHQQHRPRATVPRWLRPLSVFAIANLLLLGLWLPLLASMWPWSPQLAWDFSVTAQPSAVLIAALPPALVALMISLVRPALLTRNLVGLSVALVTAVLAGVAVRGDATPVTQQIYAEFLPLVMAAAMVCLGLLVTLAICQWRELAFHRRDAQAPAPWVQRGTVVSSESDGGLATRAWVGVITFEGWLAGFRSHLRGFRVRTESGQLVDVPKGSLLSMPLTSQSVSANPHSPVAQLSIGDPVAVAGYVNAGGDGIYRSSPVPVASSEGVIVYARGEYKVLEGLALLLWRPCLLYLVATTAIAIPGLVGLPL